MTRSISPAATLFTGHVDYDSMGKAVPRPANTGKDEGRRDHGQASGQEKGELAPDLNYIVHAWPELPEAVKAGILAMVKATGRAGT
jgi:hypothetical protein